MPISTLPSIPDIISDNEAHEEFLANRIAEFEAYCPLERATTYYIDQVSGDDNNNGLSEVAAWKTISKIVSEESGNGPDCAYLLKRGCEWREHIRLEFSNTDCTLADYGDPEDEMPFVNAYIQDYSSSTWTNTSGNVWTTPELTELGQVREQNDRQGETRGTMLAHVTTSAAVGTTANSWNWTSNVLSVNLNGGNPNTIDLEGVPNDHGPGNEHLTTGKHGIRLSKDGNRAEGVRFDGHGSTVTSVGSQIQPLTSGVTGTDAVYFKNCEAYCGSTHTAAHWSSSGGKFMFNGCTAGFAHATSGTVSIFNAYNSTGSTGNFEGWFVNCNAKYGRLPSTAYGPTISSSSVADGVGFLCHTGGNSIDFMGVYNCKCAATYNPVKQSLSLGDVSAANCVVSKLLVEKPLSGKHSSGSWPSANTTLYASKFYFFPANPGAHSQLDVALRDQTLSNCYVELDASLLSNSFNFGFFNLASGNNTIKFYHTFIKVTGAITTTANRFGIDFDVRGSTAGPGLGLGINYRLFNSIVSYDNADADAMNLGLINTASGLINNAYYQVRNSGTTEDRGYGNTANRIILASQPSLNTYNASLRTAALSGVTGMPVHSHDINGKPRINLSVPDIGPTDFSVPSGISTPDIFGEFNIGETVTADDGDWSDGSGTRYWRKALTSGGSGAGIISGETGTSYLIDIADIVDQEYLGLRVVWSNSNGSVTGDSPWYLVSAISDEQDVTIGQDGLFNVISISLGNNVYSKLGDRVSYSSGYFEMLDNRLDHRKYYRRNRSD